MVRFFMQHNNGRPVSIFQQSCITDLAPGNGIRVCRTFCHESDGVGQMSSWRTKKINSVRSYFGISGVLLLLLPARKAASNEKHFSSPAFISTKLAYLAIFMSFSSDPHCPHCGSDQQEIMWTDMPNLCQLWWKCCWAWTIIATLRCMLARWAQQCIAIKWNFVHQNMFFTKLSRISRLTV